MSKYVHKENIHNSESSDIIVPFILNILNVKSVVDFGCGLGNFIKSFKKHGVEEILGLDGTWVDMDRLFQNINKSEFSVVDLEGPIKLGKKYDLGICLEVAEHLTQESEQVLVESLVNASDIILFSAAIPGQGGQNHINEQWLSHWADLFSVHGYLPVDIVRSKLWNDSRIKWWYRQNLVFFVHKDSKLAKYKTEAIDYIHPELFKRKVDHIENSKRMIEQLKMNNENLSNTYNNLKELTSSPFQVFKLLIKSFINR